MPAPSIVYEAAGPAHVPGDIPHSWRDLALPSNVFAHRPSCHCAYFPLLFPMFLHPFFLLLPGRAGCILCTAALFAAGRSCIAPGGALSSPRPGFGEAAGAPRGPAQPWPTLSHPGRGVQVLFLPREQCPGAIPTSGAVSRC